VERTTERATPHSNAFELLAEPVPIYREEVAVLKRFKSAQ